MQTNPTSTTKHLQRINHEFWCRILNYIQIYSDWPVGPLGFKAPTHRLLFHWLVVHVPQNVSLLPVFNVVRSKMVLQRNGTWIDQWTPFQKGAVARLSKCSLHQARVMSHSVDKINKDRFASNMASIIWHATWLMILAPGSNVTGTVAFESKPTQILVRPHRRR